MVTPDCEKSPARSRVGRRPLARADRNAGLQPFVRVEEERPVLLDRPADRRRRGCSERSPASECRARCSRRGSRSARRRGECSSRSRGTGWCRCGSTRRSCRRRCVRTGRRRCSSRPGLPAPRRATGTKARLPLVPPSRLVFGAPSSVKLLLRATPPLIEMPSMPPLSNGRSWMLWRLPASPTTPGTMCESVKGLRPELGRFSTSS